MTDPARIRHIFSQPTQPTKNQTCDGSRQDPSHFLSNKHSHITYSVGVPHAPTHMEKLPFIAKATTERLLLSGRSGAPFWRSLAFWCSLGLGVGSTDCADANPDGICPWHAILPSLCGCFQGNLLLGRSNVMREILLITSLQPGWIEIQSGQQNMAYSKCFYRTNSTRN